MLFWERLSLYFLSLFITETLLQFKNELVGILMQAILDNFSPAESQELHRLVLVVCREIQEHDFPDSQNLSYEQRLLYLPLPEG